MSDRETHKDQDISQPSINVDEIEKEIGLKIKEQFKSIQSELRRELKKELKNEVLQ